MGNYLSQKELEQFLQYKHSAPKTTLEAALIKYIWLPFDTHVIPDFLSANFVTVAGQIPTILLFIYFLFCVEDQTYSDLGSTPYWIVTIGALCYYWFSTCDIIDGVRARRLKCGSPLGRIIDEGLDLVAYSGIANTALWMVRPASKTSFLVFSLVNLPFCTTEIRHYAINKLQFVVDELGPVEIELIFSLIIGISGLFAEPFYNNPALTYLGVEVLNGVTWGHLFICVIGLLLVLMSFDNLTESFQKKPAKSAFCLIAPALLLTQGYF